MKELTPADVDAHVVRTAGRAVRVEEHGVAHLELVHTYTLTLTDLVVGGACDVHSEVGEALLEKARAVDTAGEAVASPGVRSTPELHEVVDDILSVDLCHQYPLLSTCIMSLKYVVAA